MELIWSDERAPTGYIDALRRGACDGEFCGSIGVAVVNRFGAGALSRDVTSMRRWKGGVW
jgi:hypothetical protein